MRLVQDPQDQVSSRPRVPRVSALARFRSSLPLPTKLSLDRTRAVDLSNPQFPSSHRCQSTSIAVVSVCMFAGFASVSTRTPTARTRQSHEFTHNLTVLSRHRAVRRAHIVLIVVHRLFYYLSSSTRLDSPRLTSPASSLLHPASSAKHRPSCSILIRLHLSPTLPTFCFPRRSQPASRTRGLPRSRRTADDGRAYTY